MTQDQIKKSLRKLGYVAVDFDFVEAVKEFQLDVGITVDGIAGPVTQGKISKWASPADIGGIDLPPGLGSDGEPAWLKLCKSFDGMHEIGPDGKVNPIVTEFFSYTSYPTRHNEPWCAAAQCYMMAKTGMKNPRRADVLGWVDYGLSIPFEDAQLGDMVCMAHPGGGRHITQFNGWVDKGQKLLNGYGGNQGNRMKNSVYDFKKEILLGVRRPVKAA